MTAPDLQFVPPDILGKLASLKPYTLLLLKKGPAYDSTETLRIIQSEHLPYLFRLREEGSVALSLPVTDNTGLAAIAIYTSTDKDEVKRLAENDPAVQQGIFIPEVFSCIGLKGDNLP